MAKKVKLFSEDSPDSVRDIENSKQTVAEEFKPAKAPKANRPAITFEEIDAVADETIAANEPVAFIPDVAHLSAEKITEQVKQVKADKAASEAIVEGSVEHHQVYMGALMPRDILVEELSKLNRQVLETKNAVLETTSLSRDDLGELGAEVIVGIRQILTGELEKQTNSVNQQLSQLQSAVARELGKVPQLISMIKNEIGGLRRQLEALSLGESTEIAKVEEIVESPLDDQFKKAIRKYILTGLVDSRGNAMSVETSLLAEQIMDKTRQRRAEQSEKTGLPPIPVEFDIVDLIEYIREIKAEDDTGMVSAQNFKKNGGFV